MIETGRFGKLEPINEGMYGDMNVYLSKFNNLFVISIGDMCNGKLHIFRNEEYKTEKKAKQMFDACINYEQNIPTNSSSENNTGYLTTKAEELVKNKNMREALKQKFNELKFKADWRYPLSIYFTDIDEGILITAAIWVYHHNGKLSFVDGKYNIQTWGQLTH